MRPWFVVPLLIVACSSPDPSGGPITTVATNPTTTTVSTTTTIPATSNTVAPDFAVSSPAFESGETIPVVHTCDGEDVSPPLDIVGIPEGTESLVVVVDDPDAPLGTWDHWVEYDLPADPGSLQIERATRAVGVQGVNSWNLPGYMGPCPPQGEEHQYFFTVYAIDGLLDLPAGAGSDQVYEAMEGNILGSVELVGVYGR